MKSFIIFFTLLLTVSVLRAQTLPTQTDSTTSLAEKPTSVPANFAWSRLNRGFTFGTWVFPQNRDTIWGVGGGVLRSTDGGLTWDTVTTTPNNSDGFSQILFLDQRIWLLLSGGPNPNGVNVYRTSDAGGSWNSIPTGSNEAIKGYSTSEDSAWLLGSEFVTRSTDAGRTWHQTKIGFNGIAWTAVFPNSKQGAILGEAYVLTHNPPYPEAAGLSVTTDGGETWSIVYSGIPRTVRGSCVKAGNTAFAVGDSGLIAKSTDGGRYWHTLSEMTIATLHAIAFSDSSHGTAVGSGGEILQTTDAGQTWRHQESGFNVTLEAVSFTDSLTGYISGNYGVILKTTTGGLAWVREPSSTQIHSFATPQPANSHATIFYSLPEPQHASIVLFQNTGVAVMRLRNRVFQQAGAQTVDLDVSTLPSGVYRYGIVTEKFTLWGNIIVAH